VRIPRGANMSLLYEKESYEIRGACFWVWKEFGSAFKKSIIDKALTEELLRRGLKVENQKRLDIFYQGKKVGTYIPDKIVNDSILIELKAKPFLIKSDYLQFQRYLKGSNYKLGFLINFGNKLTIKRYVYDKIREDPRQICDLSKRSARDPRFIKKIRERSAFTLVELLVAMGLFVVLIGIATGGFIRALRTQRLMVALMAANDNVNLALEQMAREIRTGYHFSKISDTELQFVNADNIVVFYRLNDGAIERGTEDVFLQRTYKKITADNVKITNFKIHLLGNNDGDGYPPRITISLSVGINNKYFENVSINVQTTISSRVLDT